MSEDEPQSAGPELRFGAPSEQEVERSRNLKLIVGVLVGPTILLMVLGYHEAAMVVFMCSIGTIIYIVRPPFHRRSPWEQDEDEVIELTLEERRSTAKPVGALTNVKTSFRR